MPRTTYGTAARAAEAERKRQDAEAKHREKVSRIIRTAAMEQGIKNVREIARVAGVDYKALYNALNGNTEWRLGNLFLVCNALDLSCEARAAILGGGKT